MILRVLSVLVGFGAGIAVAWFTEPGHRFFVFSREAGAGDEKGGVAFAQGNRCRRPGWCSHSWSSWPIVLWLTDKGLEWVFYDLILGWKKS